MSGLDFFARALRRKQIELAKAAVAEYDFRPKPAYINSLKSLMPSMKEDEEYSVDTWFQLAEICLRTDLGEVKPGFAELRKVIKLSAEATHYEILQRNDVLSIANFTVTFPVFFTKWASGLLEELDKVGLCNAMLLDKFVELGARDAAELGHGILELRRSGKLTPQSRDFLFTYPQKAYLLSENLIRFSEAGLLSESMYELLAANLEFSWGISESSILLQKYGLDDWRPFILGLLPSGSDALSVTNGESLKAIARIIGELSLSGSLSLDGAKALCVNFITSSREDELPEFAVLIGTLSHSGETIGDEMNDATSRITLSNPRHSILSSELFDLLLAIPKEETRRDCVASVLAIKEELKVKLTGDHFNRFAAIFRDGEYGFLFFKLLCNMDSAKFLSKENTAKLIGRFDRVIQNYLRGLFTVRGHHIAVTKGHTFNQDYFDRYIVSKTQSQTAFRSAHAGPERPAAPEGLHK